MNAASYLIRINDLHMNGHHPIYAGNGAGTMGVRGREAYAAHVEMLKRRGARAGIPNLHPHRFRHSFAMNALEGDMPERLLQVYGGWKKILDNYFRTLGASHINKFHQGFSPADRLGQAGETGKRHQQGKTRGRL